MGMVLTMENFDDFSKIDDGFDDIGDDSSYADMKINPSYYIHLALVKSQECFLNPMLSDGWVRFQFLTLYLESLCRSASLLDDKYDTFVKSFSLSEEYLQSDVKYRSVLLSIKKQEFLTSAIFGNRTIVSAVKFR